MCLSSSEIHSTIRIVCREDDKLPTCRILLGLTRLSTMLRVCECDFKGLMGKHKTILEKAETLAVRNLSLWKVGLFTVGRIELVSIGLVLTLNKI